uniref:Apoptosis-associated speck-like protein containing a CARD n=1 Tax=Chelydra serpentina TaxID=8475 RepID=A0A8C3XST3_CHESE
MVNVGCRSRRDLLLGTLEQLEEEKLRTFKDKLSKVELKEGYGRIPLARLTDVDPPALTDLLLSSYGEDYGIEVAAGALRAISQGDLAERLVVPFSSGLKQVPAELLSFATSPKKHFVDQHREELIQRVTAVDCILDKLYDSVLNNEQCQRVKSESTNPDKMRKLYELVVSWDNKCKNQFYDVLKTTHRHLVEELEGK